MKTKIDKYIGVRLELKHIVFIYMYPSINKGFLINENDSSPLSITYCSIFFPLTKSYFKTTFNPIEKGVSQK